MDKAIFVDNLTKKFKNGRGIENVSFDVGAGEVFGFLGPNGAGKTTAMKIMTGLMKPDEGNVYIFGKSVLTEHTQAQSSVGTIIESVAPYPYLTAYENMKMLSRYHDISDERIDECFRLTGIEKYKNEKTKGFSLGMKQRLGIAMAIAPRPKLLILDEPLNGLDVEGMFEMRELIKNMSENDGTSFLISSHLIHDIELTCTRIGIVYGGKMLGTDYTENILRSYASLEDYYLNEVNINA